MNDQQIRRVSRPRNGRKIRDRIVRHVVAQERRKPDGIAIEKQRVTIRRRLRDNLARKYAAIVDDYLVSKIARKSLCNLPCHDISGAAGIGSDYAYRLAWIFLAESHSSIGGHCADVRRTRRSTSAS